MAKEFKFIVKESKGNNEISIINDGFSWFEIAGFAKYIEIESELKLIDYARKHPKDK